MKKPPVWLLRNDNGLSNYIILSETFLFVNIFLDNHLILLYHVETGRNSGQVKNNKCQRYDIIKQ